MSKSPVWEHCGSDPAEETAVLVSLIRHVEQAHVSKQQSIEAGHTAEGTAWASYCVCVRVSVCVRERKGDKTQKNKAQLPGPLIICHFGIFLQIWKYWFQ